MSTAHILGAKKRTEDIFCGETTDFETLLLSPHVVAGLHHAGFVQPSPIQLQAIPLAKCGLDMICQAKSGTGKTCVFTVCALESLNVKIQAMQVLILAPTREIAHQILGVIETIGSHSKGLKCSLFIGGVPVEKDVENLKGCHIGVGTPGRVKYLIENNMLRTNSIHLFVLDEADKLLEEQSFQKQINWIYSTLRKEKQVLALSATYPETLASHLSNYMQDPVHVRINIGDLTLKGVKQYFTKTMFHPFPHKAFELKCDKLMDIIRKIPFQQCMVFSNFHSRAENLSKKLCDEGWPCTFISGKQIQAARTRAMDQLKNYNCRVLITTDLTARGIDCDKVDLVINLDLPWESETYLHRIGRSGRFGCYGLAISIVSDGDEFKKIQSISSEIGREISSLPDDIESISLKNKTRDFNMSNGWDYTEIEAVNIKCNGNSGSSYEFQGFKPPDELLNRNHKLDATTNEECLCREEVKAGESDSPRFVIDKTKASVDMNGKFDKCNEKQSATYSSLINDNRNDSVLLNGFNKSENSSDNIENVSDGDKQLSLNGHKDSNVLLYERNNSVSTSVNNVTCSLSSDKDRPVSFVSSVSDTIDDSQVFRKDEKNVAFGNTTRKISNDSNLTDDVHAIPSSCGTDVSAHPSKSNEQCGDRGNSTTVNCGGEKQETKKKCSMLPKQRHIPKYLNLSAKIKQKTATEDKNILKCEFKRDNDISHDCVNLALSKGTCEEITGLNERKMTNLSNGKTEEPCISPSSSTTLDEQANDCNEYIKHCGIFGTSLDISNDEDLKSVMRYEIVTSKVDVDGITTSESEVANLGRKSSDATNNICAQSLVSNCVLSPCRSEVTSDICGNLVNVSENMDAKREKTEENRTSGCKHETCYGETRKHRFDPMSVNINLMGTSCSQEISNPINSFENESFLEETGVEVCNVVGMDNFLTDDESSDEYKSEYFSAVIDENYDSQSIISNSSKLSTEFEFVRNGTQETEKSLDSEAFSSHSFPRPTLLRNIASETSSESSDTESDSDLSAPEDLKYKRSSARGRGWDQELFSSYFYKAFKDHNRLLQYYRTLCRDSRGLHCL